MRFYRMSMDGSETSAAAAAAAAKKLNLEKATNFMKQYRDPESRELKKLSANQFTEVWSHYDKDGMFNNNNNNVITFLKKTFSLCKFGLKLLR